MSAQTQRSRLVCDLTALTDGERREHASVSEEMFAALQDVKELPDGYRFRFPATADMLQTVATFIARERKCCPFYDFTVKVGFIIVAMVPVLPALLILREGTAQRSRLSWL